MSRPGCAGLPSCSSRGECACWDVACDDKRKFGKGEGVRLPCRGRRRRAPAGVHRGGGGGAAAMTSHGPSSRFPAAAYTLCNPTNQYAWYCASLVNDEANCGGCGELEPKGRRERGRAALALLHPGPAARLACSQRREVAAMTGMAHRLCCACCCPLPTRPPPLAPPAPRRQEVPRPLSVRALTAGRRPAGPVQMPRQDGKRPNQE